MLLFHHTDGKTRQLKKVYGHRAGKWQSQVTKLDLPAFTLSS